MTTQTKKEFLTKSEKAVGLAFQALMRAKRECPTQAQIASTAGVDQSTATRAMNRLVELGYYSKVEGRQRSYSVLKPVPRPA